MPTIRVHTDDNTVDFHYKKDEMVYDIAEKIATVGVWVKPGTLYPASRIVKIEVMP